MMTRFDGRLTLSLPLAVTLALSLLEPAVNAKSKGTLYPDTGCSSRMIVIGVYICMEQGQISCSTVLTSETEWLKFPKAKTF